MQLNNSSTTSNDSRGRRATRPTEIPRRGWRDIMVRFKNQLNRDNVSIISAGVAFYALLSIFPAITALISLYAFFSDPAQITEHMQTLGHFVPEQAMEIISGQMDKVASSAQAPSIGALLGLLLALWAATKATKVIFTALNIVYHEEEKRGFIKFNLMALGVTIAGVLIGVIILAAIIGVPALLGTMGLDRVAQTLIAILQWPILMGIFLLGLAVLYRFGPSRDEPRWHWVSSGAVAGTVLWTLASLAFSIYVYNFGSYNETYGTLGGVVILLFWFYLSAYVILLGAELNSETEHQTQRDTTKGPSEPMGQRGAYVADTVGKSP